MGNTQSNFEKPTDESDGSKKDRSIEAEKKIEAERRIEAEKRIEAYEKALAEGSMDVAYSRVLFLGTAGVGKTSFKRSLMKLPWEPNTTSTDVFEHEWHTLKEGRWNDVSFDEEIAHLVLEYEKELVASDAAAPYFHNKSSQSLPDTSMGEVQDIVSRVISRIENLTQQDKIKQQPFQPQPFLHFWDCGGQAPFLEILPVFLTSRTLFFLIFDAEKDLKSNWESVINIEGETIGQEEVPMTTLDYMLNWMANIHGHLMTYDDEGGHCAFPRMYCIGTHGDRVKDRKSEIKKELERHYQSKDFKDLIEDTVIVDNTSSGQGEAEDPSLQALREAVVRFTEKKLVLKTPFRWILFQKAIQDHSKKCNVISLEEARTIGAACNIPPENVHHVLMFYHELGVLLFYPQIDGMKNKIVINPNYIVDALKEIFPFSWSSERCKRKKLFRECGILVHTLYVELWEKYKKDVSPDEFINVLIHFRIAVEVKTDQYSPPSIKQYFMPLVLKSTQVDRSSMTIALPSDSIQAAPLHITFNSGFVPPGFFTRFVVVLANKIELCFEKGIYRNRVTFRYQDPNCNSIEHVIVTDCTDVIQINVIHHHPDSVSFTKICQDIRVLLEYAANEVEKILKKCASGWTVSNKSTRYIFMHEFKYVCTSCPLTNSPHYIKLPPTNSTQDSQVYCDKNTNDYRVLTELEKFWFKDTSQSTPATQTSPTSTAKSPKGNDAMKEEVLTSSDVSQAKQLNIRDLDDVMKKLKSVDYTQWIRLGLSLGLYYNTLGAIEEKCRGDVQKCLLECMAAWLSVKDNVSGKGGSSWSSLATALEEIGANDIAKNIETN